MDRMYFINYKDHKTFLKWCSRAVAVKSSKWSDLESQRLKKYIIILLY
jgi:hypothetical protein